MPKPTLGGVRDSIDALQIGTVRGINARQRQRELEGLMEREDQFAIEVSGRGEEFPSWTTVTLNFDVHFVDATGQRDADFDRPIFSYGAYIPVGGPVGLLACVTRWDIGKQNETTGCQLAIGAVATDQARKFRGEIHAVFQGYGAPKDAYGDGANQDIG